jgi:uncharacterized membrane protein
MSLLDMDNRKLGRLMGYLLLGAGIGHFIFPAGLDSIVPAALPGDPRNYTYASGVAEILIGLALLSAPHIKVLGKPLKLWGAYGAFALFLAVYPANINMAIAWSNRPMPDPLFAYARLPFQFYFLYAAWKLITTIKRRIV